MKTIFFSAIVLLANIASASYIEECKLTGKVESVQSLQLTSGDQNFDHRLVTLKVDSAVAIPGSHSDCLHHVNQSLEVDLQSVSLEDIALLKVGYPLNVDYFYGNSITPNGVQEFTRSFADTPALKVFRAAQMNKGVGEAIARTRRLLGNSADFKLGKVQKLPSYCGFAGCAQDYIVMLTYGIDDTSSPRATIVVSAHLEALGEITSLKVIKDPSLAVAL